MKQKTIHNYGKSDRFYLSFFFEYNLKLSLLPVWRFKKKSERACSYGRRRNYLSRCKDIS